MLRPLSSLLSSPVCSGQFGLTVTVMFATGVLSLGKVQGKGAGAGGQIRREG